RNIAQEPIAAGIIQSGDLFLGFNRKALHTKTVNDIRRKIESAKSSISKSTDRTVEDYLDEIADSPNLDGFINQDKYLALQHLYKTGYIEAVIIAFRSHSNSATNRAREIPNNEIGKHHDLEKKSLLNNRTRKYLARLSFAIRNIATTIVIFA